MELSAKYNPSATEDKWYAYWLEHKFFHSEPDAREPYTIVIPPPNVTGILHMGHVLNNTLNDVLIRKARMDGKNACWVPGTDHASIATENKVVAKLKAEGIEKEDLTREEFLKYAWEWKEKHGGIILTQLRKLGASCDWDRTRFTMDPDLSEAVINTFVHFYRKGYIYRGIRMVNWDPVGHTAVSDEEVIHRETVSKFYHLRYFISDGNGNPTDKYIIIATTRPETIMADAAVCINPEDERYHWLRGKKVLIPLINKEIPIIEDSYVEMGFGTGLNTFLTAIESEKARIPVEYTSIEAFPLEKGIWEKLNYADCLKQPAETFLQLHQQAFDGKSRIISPYFKLTKIQGLLQETSLPENHFHVIYYDAFAPSVQPELWQTSIFQQLHNAAASPCFLSTYCAQGQFKRNLREAGFEVSNLPGPAGKREITVGRIE